MSKKLGIVLIIIVALSVCCSAVSIGLLAAHLVDANKDDGAEMVDQYVMYVGTNDKDTYAQVYDIDKCKEIIDDICFKYFEGYTIQEATGSWVDKNKNATHEHTIVCIFDDADRETVYKVADEVLVALNQSSVLIENKKIVMDYYEGQAK